jgi:hypothetical protein
VLWEHEVVGSSPAAPTITCEVVRGFGLDVLVEVAREADFDKSMRA